MHLQCLAYSAQGEQCDRSGQRQRFNITNPNSTNSGFRSNCTEASFLESPLTVHPLLTSIVVGIDVLSFIRLLEAVPAVNTSDRISLFCAAVVGINNDSGWALGAPAINHSIIPEIGR